MRAWQDMVRRAQRVVRCGKEGGDGIRGAVPLGELALASEIGLGLGRFFSQSIQADTCHDAKWPANDE